MAVAPASFGAAAGQALLTLDGNGGALIAMNRKGVVQSVAAYLRKRSRMAA